MTPDQLHRKQRANDETAAIRRLTLRVPASVINGGAMRAAAFKVAAGAALKALQKGVSDPSKLRELRLAIESSVSAGDDSFSRAAHVAR